MATATNKDSEQEVNLDLDEDYLRAIRNAGTASEMCLLRALRSLDDAAEILHAYDFARSMTEDPAYIKALRRRAAGHGP